ncbi:MAG: putative membrane protein [Kiritimatiellia bacterium]|jgi:uncharacterized membrane protein
MIVTLIQLIVFFGVPIISIWACHRSKILNALSPVLLCYAAGIAFGNLVPLDTMYNELAVVEAHQLEAQAHDEQPTPATDQTTAPAGEAVAPSAANADHGAADTVTDPNDAPHKPGEFTAVEKTTNLVAGLGVILAIGMLMVSTDFVKWLRLARVTLLGAFLAMLSAVLVTTVSAVALRAYSDKLWQVAGMLVGVYTGGTINLASIARALNVDTVTWGVVHTSDMLVCGVYFLFLLLVGPKVFGLFLKPFKHPERPTDEADDDADNAKLKPMDFVRSIGVGLLVIALPIGLSQVVPSSMEEPIAILGVTTMAIVLSFARPLREVRGLYVTGDYMLLVFCVAAGSLATLSRLYGADPFFFLYTALVVVSAVTVHAALCWLFGVDRDTTIITSVAALFGPPFVPPVAAKLGNREIVVSGVTSGLVGLAAGNYLGLMVAYFVKWAAG